MMVLMKTLGMKLVLMVLVGLLASSLTAAAEPRLKVLCTTFPVYQMTRNVAEGRDGIALELMLPAAMGCPHDYTLTPQDMLKLGKADVLVVNGLGLEDFLGTHPRQARPELAVLDSSEDVEGLLAYGHGEHEDHGHGHGEPASNPHLFASPRMAALLVKNIAAGLGKADPAGAALYAKNGEAYVRKLEGLADELAALGKRLVCRRVVTQHAIFDYLARDMGIEIAAVIQAHAGQEPSAAEMLELLRSIRRGKACAVFTEPQYADSVARTIAEEAGVPLALLDPMASGPEDAPLDYYERTTRKNMDRLIETLGAAPE